MTESIEELGIQRNIPLKNLSTWKIGGNAEFYASPSALDIGVFVKWARDNAVRITILGAGSNVLIPSSGIKGLVLNIGKKMSTLSIEDDVLIAESGAFLPKVCKFCSEHGYADMNFLAGIPGTLGGAIFMNAGLGGEHPKEIKDLIIDATILREDGNVETLSKKDLCLSHRHSVLHDKFGIVLKARFHLGKKHPPELLKKQIQEDLLKRKEKQPINPRNAGSIFKSCEGIPAAKLIDEAGLKGYRCGDAMISLKHANWIENLRNANSDDVLSIIDTVKKTVREKFNKKLELEVVLLGKD